MNVYDSTFHEILTQLGKLYLDREVIDAQIEKAKHQIELLSQLKSKESHE